MKDDAVIKDNEAVYLINEQTYLHLRENIEGTGYEVFEKESPLPVEEGQIPREILGDSQRRIEAAREYYLAEHFDDPVVKIQNVAVTTLEKFRSGVRKRRTLDPHSLPDDDVRFIDPRYNELFRVPDGSMVQLKFLNGRQYSEKVEYLDDYHMRIGSAVQHICEFAERMARSHATVEPEPLTQQDYRVWNLEYDFYLTVQENNGLWEYELMLMMLYNTGTRQGLVRELRLMQCYLMPDETALRELSEQVIEKLKRLTDAEFAGLEFPMN